MDIVFTCYNVAGLVSESKRVFALPLIIRAKFKKKEFEKPVIIRKPKQTISLRPNNSSKYLKNIYK